MQCFKEIPRSWHAGQRVYVLPILSEVAKLPSKKGFTSSPINRSRMQVFLYPCQHLLLSISELHWLSVFSILPNFVESDGLSPQKMLINFYFWLLDRLVTFSPCLVICIFLLLIFLAHVNFSLGVFFLFIYRSYWYILDNNPPIVKCV